MFGILFIYFPSSPVGLNGKVELKCCKSKRFSNIKPQKTSVVGKLSDCTFVKLMTEMLLRPSSNCNLQRKHTNTQIPRKCKTPIWFNHSPLPIMFSSDN